MEQERIEVYVFKSKDFTGEYSLLAVGEGFELNAFSEDFYFLRQTLLDGLTQHGRSREDLSLRMDAPSEFCGCKENFPLNEKERTKLEKILSS